MKGSFCFGNTIFKKRNYLIFVLLQTIFVLDKYKIDVLIMVLNSITGILTQKQSSFACCQVGGIEWLLAMSEQSLSMLPAIGSEVCIYTQLKLSENSIVLYGFTSYQERSLFESLVSVSGIGPKAALAMLSKAKVGNLAAAIIEGDAQFLSTLPGLGTKTAQKIILQLGDKLAKQLLQHSPNQAETIDNKAANKQLPEYYQKQTEYTELLNALVAMGYAEPNCRKVLDQLSNHWQQNKPEEGEQLRQAIVGLSSV